MEHKAGGESQSRFRTVSLLTSCHKDVDGDREVRGGGRDPEAGDIEPRGAHLVAGIELPNLNPGYVERGV